MSRDILGHAYDHNDGYYDTEDMANALMGILQNHRTLLDDDDCINYDIVLSETEEALYHLKTIADNPYNSAYFRVLWNLLQAVTETCCTLN